MVLGTVSGRYGVGTTDLCAPAGWRPHLRLRGVSLWLRGISLRLLRSPPGSCGRPCDTATCRAAPVVVVRGPSDFSRLSVLPLSVLRSSVLRLPVLRLAETADRLRKRDRSERFDVPARLWAAEPRGIPCGSAFGRADSAAARPADAIVADARRNARPDACSRDDPHAAE